MRKLISYPKIFKFSLINVSTPEEAVEHFLGQCSATVLLRGNTFYNHCMTARDIFKKHAPSTINKFIRLTNHFSDPDTDSLDQ